ncbi:hypothetical protein [Lysobacter sp. F6437]|uniref:hypothetical protein n=1 Tax=Lysobacter sp. F6437 TaxID=3459296 RepID=UPI00403E1E85
MRMIRGVVLAMALVCGGQVTAAENEAEESQSIPFLGGFLEETRIVYPLQVGGWHADGEKRYATQESGVSVRYRGVEGDEGWIDLFFYPAGVVEASLLKVSAQQEMEGIAIARTNAGDTVASSTPLRTLEVAMGGEDEDPVAGYIGELEVTINERDHSSVMALFIHDLYFVKVRMSVSRETQGSSFAAETVEAFVSEVLPRTSITSTGACWQPFPVESIPVGEIPSEGSYRFVAESEGGDAWFTGDRVLAVDPDGEPARAALLLAMAMQDRLYPGCVDSEPRNPVVAEGEREIRIEYRPEN